MKLLYLQAAILYTTRSAGSNHRKRNAGNTRVSDMDHLCMQEICLPFIMKAHKSGSREEGRERKGGPGPTASDPARRAKQDKQDDRNTGPQGTPHDQAARPTPKGRRLPKTNRTKPAAGAKTPRAATQQQMGEQAPPPPRSPREAEPIGNSQQKAPNYNVSKHYGPYNRNQLQGKLKK